MVLAERKELRRVGYNSQMDPHFLMLLCTVWIAVCIYLIDRELNQSDDERHDYIEPLDPRSREGDKVA